MHKSKVDGTRDGEMARSVVKSTYSFCREPNQVSLTHFRWPKPTCDFSIHGDAGFCKYLNSYIYPLTHAYTLLKLIKVIL